MTTQTIAARRAAQAKATLMAYRRLFSTDDGKIVMQDMMRSCYFFTPTVGATPYDTAYNEGMRSAVLRLMSTSRLKEKEIEQLAASLTEESAGDYIS